MRLNFKLDFVSNEEARVARLAKIKKDLEEKHQLIGKIYQFENLDMANSKKIYLE